jgi:hypothetical protein
MKTDLRDQYRDAVRNGLRRLRNPHLTVRGSWFGHEFINVAATNPTPSAMPFCRAT